MSPLAVWCLVLVAAAADAAAPTAVAKTAGERAATAPDRVVHPIHYAPVDLPYKIHFAPNKADVPPQFLRVLDGIAGTLKGVPELVLIAVQGQVDRGESPRLALARARAVIALLKQRGVEAPRLVAGRIAGRARVCTTGPECRAFNRRVEFAILERTDGAKPLPP